MVGHTIRFEDKQWERFNYWVGRARQDNPEFGSPAAQIRRWMRIWIDMQEKDHQ